MRKLNIPEETRERMREAKRGDRNPMRNPETLAKATETRRRIWAYGKAYAEANKLLVKADGGAE